jgi:hypothetical protein
MANGNATPNRLGQINATGDAFALFLKTFAGEVLTTFETQTVFKALHTIRTIKNGKSAQFPVTGIASAAYHTPGESIADAGNSYLSTIKHGERVINIDKMLLSSAFIANLDEAQNHYDVRSIYTTEIGRALAREFDKTISRVIVKAARTAAYLGLNNAGTKLAKGATGLDTGAEIASAIYEAAEELDKKNVPDDSRYCVLRPTEYYKLVRELSEPTKPSPVGSYVDGSVARVANVTIVKSNNVPADNFSSTANQGSAVTNNDYSVDMTDTVGLVFHPASVGTVKLLDLAVESEYQIERQGTLMVAKYAMGHGILRPECAVELSKAAS